MAELHVDAEPEYPPIFYNKYLRDLTIHPFLISALDRAYWDFYGRWTEKNIIDYMDWTWQEKEIPTSSYTIGLDKKEKMAQKIRTTSWPLYKIKVNGKQPLALLQYLRSFTDAPFMIDANGSLDIKQLDELIDLSSDLKLELIEQPLSRGKDHLLQGLMDQEEVLLAVDESIRNMDDIARLRPFYHVVNFKLMKNGGFTPCINLLEKAGSLGYKKMMGCMTASSVSIAAICPFLPILDYVDMDGALLLTNDIASGIEFNNGRCVKPTGPGFGFTINEELVQKMKVA